jgi:hypothetical protein
MNFPDGVRVSKCGSIQAGGVACLPGQWGKRGPDRKLSLMPVQSMPVQRNLFVMKCPAMTRFEFIS